MSGILIYQLFSVSAPLISNGRGLDLESFSPNVLWSVNIGIPLVLLLSHLRLKLLLVGLLGLGSFFGFLGSLLLLLLFLIHGLLNNGDWLFADLLGGGAHLSLMVSDLRGAVRGTEWISLGVLVVFEFEGLGAHGQSSEDNCRVLHCYFFDYFLNYIFKTLYYLTIFC